MISLFSTSDIDRDSEPPIGCAPTTVAPTDGTVVVDCRFSWVTENGATMWSSSLSKMVMKSRPQRGVLWDVGALRRRIRAGKRGKLPSESLDMTIGSLEQLDVVV